MFNAYPDFESTFSYPYLIPLDWTIFTMEWNYCIPKCPTEVDGSAFFLLPPCDWSSKAAMVRPTLRALLFKHWCVCMGTYTYRHAHFIDTGQSNLLLGKCIVLRHSKLGKLHVCTFSPLSKKINEIPFEAKLGGPYFKPLNIWFYYLISWSHISFTHLFCTLKSLARFLPQLTSIHYF